MYRPNHNQLVPWSCTEPSINYGCIHLPINPLNAKIVTANLSYSVKIVFVKEKRWLYVRAQKRLASSPGPLGEGRKGPGTHRLRMRRLYHVVAIIFRTRNLRACCVYCADHMANYIYVLSNLLGKSRTPLHCRRQDTA